MSDITVTWERKRKSFFLSANRVSAMVVEVTKAEEGIPFRGTYTLLQVHPPHQPQVDPLNRIAPQIGLWIAPERGEGVDEDVLVGIGQVLLAINDILTEEAEKMGGKLPPWTDTNYWSKTLRTGTAKAVGDMLPEAAVIS